MILPLPSPQYEIIPKILQKFSPKNPTHKWSTHWWDKIRRSNRFEIKLLRFLMGNFLRLSPWSRGLSRIFYFSLWIVKFLQLNGRRKIVKSCKYCLVWLFSLMYIFSLFLHLTNLRILCIFPRITNRASLHDNKLLDCNSKINRALHVNKQ